MRFRGRSTESEGRERQVVRRVYSQTFRTIAELAVDGYLTRLNVCCPTTDAGIFQQANINRPEVPVLTIENNKDSQRCLELDNNDSRVRASL